VSWAMTLQRHPAGNGALPRRGRSESRHYTVKLLLAFRLCILIHGEQHGLRKTFNYSDIPFIESEGNIRKDFK
jgi:hypothetical protein